MFRVVCAFCLSLLFFAGPAARAQDSDNPTIAIVQFGANAIVSFAKAGIANTLYAYGYVSDEELATTDPGHGVLEDIAGPQLEKLNLHYFDANLDFAALNALVDTALDQEPDIVIALEETAALSVVNATATLEDPPAVLFAAVPNPYRGGMAEASCVKPAHVSGTHSLLPYDEILPMYLVHDPDLQAIGVIFNSNEGSSHDAAEQIAEAGESLGWRVELAGITGFADLGPATGGLLSRGVDAIVLPNFSFLLAGQPIIINVAGEAGAPVFTIGMDGSLYRQGAMIGISFNQWYDQGANLGRIAVALLNGELDIAEAGISTVDPLLGFAVNEAYAERWGVDLSPELLEAADIRISPEGRMQIQTARVRREWGRMLAPTPLEARQESDQAFVESIRCAPETIAEQQAALESE